MTENKSKTTIVIINSEYRLEIDKLNYTLQKRVVHKKSNSEKPDKWKVFGYYSKLEDALHNIFNTITLDKLETKTCISITELLEIIRESKRELNKLLSL